MTDRELMQQALEALNRSDYLGWQLNIPIIKALRERLAQPEQEPFGYFQYDPRLDAWVQNREGRPGTPFYTTPPQRKPLTDEKIEACRQQGFAHSGLSASFDFVKAARAIEAAHGIKGET